ncbi:MAG: hypothetical protein E7458_06755 [Ruminococcaceae bacterium]|nr:hypothetical protein [Oscillospiraceae bacterium]
MKRWSKAIPYTILTAFAAALLVIACKSAAQVQEYRAVERHAQLYAMSTLSGSLAGLSDTLQKGCYAASPELMTAVSLEIWDHSAAAIAAIAALPLSDISLEQTETFIAQAGDYAAYLARRAAADLPIESSEVAALADLAERAEDLSLELLALESDLYTGTAAFETDRRGHLATAVQRFSDLESGFSDRSFPDYDGAKSSHLLTRASLLTENEAEISEETARERAATALGVSAAELSAAGESDGMIPAYPFRDASGAYAAVSRRGGHILSMHRRDSGREGMVTVGTALDTAKSYLEKIGYAGLQQIYYHKENGTVLFRFVSREENHIRCYPDLITVGVSLSDGSVVSLDAADYVMNHHARTLPEPAVGQTAAARTISPSLDYRYAGLVVIHSPGMQELLCHEFLCRTEEGQRLLLYVNAETGGQCHIAMLHEDENGVFMT